MLETLTHPIDEIEAQHATSKKKKRKTNVRNPNAPHWRNQSPTPNIKQEQTKRTKGKKK